LEKIHERAVITENYDSGMRLLIAVASWIYRWIAQLYPVDFRAAFGAEMQSVFDQALMEHARNNFLRVLAFCLLEIKDFPANVLRQHWQGIWNKGGKMSTISEPIHHLGTPSQKVVHQSGDWRSAFLAGLPHFLVGLIGAIGKIYGSGAYPLYTPIATAIAIALMLLVVGLLLYAWRTHWPLWSASWYMHGAWIVIVILSLGIERLNLEESWRYTNLLLPIWIGACVVGYFLILSRDRLKGLLAIAFVFPFIGLGSLEFIPNSFEAWLAIVVSALVALAAAAVVRLGGFHTALVTVLGANALAGLMLAYTSEYQLKDLPSGAPAHIPQFSGFLALLGLYLLIGVGVVSLPFLVQGLWRFGKRGFTS